MNEMYHQPISIMSVFELILGLTENRMQIITIIIIKKEAIAYLCHFSPSLHSMLIFGNSEITRFLLG